MTKMGSNAGKTLEMRDEETKRTIVNFAIAHGITRASREYNAHEQDIRRWGERLGLMTVRPKQVFTDDQIRDMLNRARMLMSENPIDYPNARAAFVQVGAETNTNPSVLYKLNQKYHIIPVQTKIRSQRMLSAAEILAAKQAVAETNSISAASRKTGISRYTITRIMNEAAHGK